MLIYILPRTISLSLKAGSHESYPQNPSSQPSDHRHQRSADSPRHEAQRSQGNRIGARLPDRRQLQRPQQKATADAAALDASTARTGSPVLPNSSIRPQRRASAWHRS